MARLRTVSSSVCWSVGLFRSPRRRLLAGAVVPLLYRPCVLTVAAGSRIQCVLTVPYAGAYNLPATSGPKSLAAFFARRPEQVIERKFIRHLTAVAFRDEGV